MMMEGHDGWWRAMMDDDDWWWWRAMMEDDDWWWWRAMMDDGMPWWMMTRMTTDDEGGPFPFETTCTWQGCIPRLLSQLLHRCANQAWELWCWSSNQSSALEETSVTWLKLCCFDPGLPIGPPGTPNLFWVEAENPTQLLWDLNPKLYGRTVTTTPRRPPGVRCFNKRREVVIWWL